jgi:catechol 2,3-dioxygenase-like lactoylglutathione lyase family enzyme
MIVLDHTHIPARDKDASARQFADVFGLSYDGPQSSWYAAVQVNDTYKVMFIDYVEPRDVHHYAFHVDDETLDACLVRVQEAGIAYGSDPDDPANGRLNSFEGGRGFYYLDLDGHLMELLTEPGPGV